MRILTLIVVSFVVFCGWLIAESGIDSRSFDLAQDKLRGNDREKRCLLKIYFYPT